MSNERREVIELLLEHEAISFGSFTLKSGESSPFFVDLGQLRTADALQAVGRMLARELVKRFSNATLLFGPAYKGIALATATALGCLAEHGRDMPIAYNRKESKAQGERGAFIGQTPRPNDRIVIIDDVLSSGGTKLEAAQAIESAFGVLPIGVLVVLDRTRRMSPYDGRRLPAFSLCNVVDLADHLMSRSDDRGELVRRFWQGEP